MNDQRFLKVKKVSEERYFHNDIELIRFIEKQNEMSWEEMIDLYKRLYDHKSKIGLKFWETHMNLDRKFLVIGNFIFSIYRGCYQMTSGEYAINILAQQKTDHLTGNDINKLFNLPLNAA